MMRARWLVLLVMLCAVSAHGQQLGRRIPDILFGTKSIYGCSSVVFDGTDLPQTSIGGKCTVTVSSSIIPHAGSCIGNAGDTGGGNDFCTTVDFTSRTLNMTSAAKTSGLLCPQKAGGGSCSVDGDCNSGFVCLATRCTAKESGSTCWHDVLLTQFTGDGTRPLSMARSVVLPHLGGDGTDGAFTYGGEGSGNCSGAICNGGTCVGSNFTGTCTLSLNSPIGRAGNEAVDASTAAIRNYTTFSMTAGTLKVATPVSNWGAPVVLRALDAISLSGGTIDVSGMGGLGGTGGTCTGNTTNNAGKPGGTTLQPSGAAGAAGANAGAAGKNLLTDVGMQLFTFPFNFGSGGGAAGTLNSTAGTTLLGNPWGPPYGATGGGGPGCASTCTTGSGGNGGRGGGLLRLESGKSITLSAGTIDLRGLAGGTAASGGGGGTLHLVGPSITNSLTTNTTTCSGSNLVCVGGGAAGGALTNCGAAAAGGVGGIASWVVP